LHAPIDEHFQVVKRILQYVKCTLQYGLSFIASSSTRITAYSNADWARCPDTRHSISSYSIYLGDNLVSWSAKKQPTISYSSCEFEYHAFTSIIAEVLWLDHLLRDLYIPRIDRPLLLYDNKSPIFLSSNPVSHKRFKHINLDYHFLHELVVAGRIRIQYVPSTLQVIGVFTKSVSRPLFTFFRSKLRMCSNPMLSSRGGVGDSPESPPDS
jgi:hypothetical protein